MAHKKISCLLALIAAFAPVTGIHANQAQTQATDIPSQIAALDKEIKEFKDARDRAQTQAYLARNQATQGQVQQQDWLGYRRALRKQEMYEEKVKLLDERIAELEKQRADLQAKLKK